MHTRPVWVEISRGNLTANYRALRALAREHLSSAPQAPPLADPALLGVVKANAYGHGLAECAPALAQAGAEWLGVTSVEEGIQARSVCPTARILVLSGVWDGEAGGVVEHRLTPVVWEAFHLDLLEAEARRQGLPPQSVPVHLELDSGMSRQGISPRGPAIEEILMRFHSVSALRLDGVATHFSAPEDLASDETERQRSRFEAALAKIAAHGLRPRWIHAGNSATLLHGAHLAPLARAAAGLGARLMLRPGLSLYGYAPRFAGAGADAAREAGLAARLAPVLAWKTRVVSLREIEAGEAVGYNAIFRAARRTRLALLPVGYADGLGRLLSNRGHALVRGRRAPIAGRISMDQTVLDVTDIPETEIGDEAVLLGGQGNESITAWELADLAGTIPYEVLCAISARVPRVTVD